METTERFKQRAARVDAAFRMEKPDRVPFAPRVAGFFMSGYGISFYDAMQDPRNVIPGIRGFIQDYDPDALVPPGYYNIDSLEALGTSFLRWPGPTHHLPLESSYQHLDAEHLHDDEYGEFIDDPTNFILTKLLPRKHQALRGLKKLNFQDVYDKNLIDSFTVLTDPEVRDALDAMLDAGKACKNFRARNAVMLAAFQEAECPLLAQGAMVIPFDSFADSVRGIMRTILDLYEFPDELEAAVAKLTRQTVTRQVEAAAGRGAKRIAMPLHCGVDSFMSNDLYARYYWPNLRLCIDAIIDHGMTPICFCEGSYDSRLEIISDVPKGKVGYMFEKVDIVRAKQTVGKVGCLFGTMPSTLLAFGKPEAIIAETKRQIDVLGPGGGFIMDCTITLDNAEHENMRAWRETTEIYGKY